MQEAFDFGAGAEIAWMRDRLAAAYGSLVPPPRREPVGQLVRSLLGSRTRDEVSLAVYLRLREAFPRWADLAAAPAEKIERTIAPVSFAERKAPQIGAALRMVARQHPDFDLGVLADRPLAESLAWLERLPGVGPKIAAATLNFSTLERPAFVVDTHVLRVLRRYRLVGTGAETHRARDAVMAATPGWSAFALTELHALLKRLGQTACRAGAPHCGECPLAARCWTASRRISPLGRRVA